MHFTDTTFRLIQSLEKRGYMIRQVVNAGVVLFNRAEIPSRGRAVALSHGMIEEEIQEVLARLKSVVSYMDANNCCGEFTTEDLAMKNKVKRILSHF